MVTLGSTRAVRVDLLTERTCLRLLVSIRRRASNSGAAWGSCCRGGRGKVGGRCGSGGDGGDGGGVVMGAQVLAGAVKDIVRVWNRV